jgi:hypothetical protein
VRKQNLSEHLRSEAAIARHARRVAAYLALEAACEAALEAAEARRGAALAERRARREAALAERRARREAREQARKRRALWKAYRADLKAARARESRRLTRKQWLDSLPKPERRPDDESGVPGVTWDRRLKRWRAGGVGDNYGKYLTVADAARAVADYKSRRRGLPCSGEESVRRTDRNGVEDLTLEIAGARLANSGRFASRGEAEAALLSGVPVRTAHCVYELIVQPAADPPPRTAPPKGRPARTRLVSQLKRTE